LNTLVEKMLTTAVLYWRRKC